MTNNLIMIAYLISSVLFIFSIRGLASPETARRGNLTGALAMLIAVVATLFVPSIKDYYMIALAILVGGVIGYFSAVKVKMTSLPQMVAVFNGFGGLAAVFISLAEIIAGSQSYIESSIGLLIGAIAFSGSVIAFAKLQGLMSGKAITFKFQHGFNALLGIVVIAVAVKFVMMPSLDMFYILAGLSIFLGFMLIIPIGGADMPVVISVLNSYSGFAACGIGFSLGNMLLIIVGAIVGASGAILSYIMCKGMNRSLVSVMLGGFGAEDSASTAGSANGGTAKSGSPEDASFIMQNAQKVIIVPGYGMAVAQAQHILREMSDSLKAEGVEVKYAIHPVAGRMPGHMNVLLAEANVPYEEVFELEDINREFATADVVYVIGANDVTNPLAKTDSTSAIYGMPILEIEKAKTIFFVKRSLSPGYAGVDNPMFYADNTMMLFGDAKQITEKVVSAMD